MMFRLNVTLLLLVCWSPVISFASSESDVIAQIVEQRSDAVVLIAVSSPDGDRLGSGFFISRDGKFVTNYHVIKGAEKVVVKLRNGTAFLPQRIVNLDPAKDIAVIQIDRNSPAYFPLGNSNEVASGERVLTIGNPQGLENTVADGLISSIRMNEAGMKIFQISVPLSNGSSGGPLINMKGEAIGITTASMAVGESLNFAVPINYVRILLRKPFHGQKDHAALWLKERPKVQESFSRDPKISAYVVQKGDSLFSIAKRFKTSVQQLQRLNRLKDSKIIPGQRLTLP
jgi:S1-C subfamily serine protease